MSVVSKSSNDLLKELKAVEEALKSTESKIKVLVKKRDGLHKEKLEIKQKIKREESRKLQNKNWYNKDYPWMVKLDDLLKNVFKIEELRSYQLPTINAVMQKQCTIIIMPTGAGKSLCYQIPALLLSGVTLVISPLVSLMEDQVMALKSLSIAADLIHSGRQQKENTEVEKKMMDGNLKLVYCAPEKLAKSKRFMSKLEKVYAAKKLALIAIDEVHCCSQWGHDFRQDYKFLGILRKQFPLTPLLGLTATAPTTVLEDVQELLNIDGCLVFKAPLNRPNLFYEVKHKSNVHQEVISEIAALIDKQFPNQSGIIYCLSIKDSIEIAKDLRDHGIKAKPYNAQLPPEERKKIHLKWISRDIHIIVATIAFGMGIDKPDVRFVIHHSISKSMESYYQESGRAGRDNNPAKCIAFFRISDMFRLSCMVFSDRTGLDKLYGMVEYCIDKTRCRREVMAEHFGEDEMLCDGMCDSCKNSGLIESTDVTKLFKLIYTILKNASSKNERMTASKLLDTIQGKSHSKLRPHNFQIVDFSREKLEYILAFLLIERYLEEDFHFTPYTTISYLKLGSKDYLEDQQLVVHLPSLKSRNLPIDLNLPKLVSSNSKSSSNASKQKNKLKETEPPLKKRKNYEKISKTTENQSDSDSCEIVYTEIDSSFGKFV